GHANGQGASRMIINGIAQRMMNNLFLPPLNSEEAGQEVKPLEDTDLIAMLKEAVQESNNELVQANQRNKSDAGSTLTGFMIVNDHAYIINVGDSRTYLLREGTLYQLTTDHSLVAQLVAGGLIEPDDVYTHPQRSQIFRSLGDKNNVQIDDFK
ncbi:MAG TPA: protein phosphatase, partial [Ktedonobacter sp.]|nr:protein phosphatase [Ktedonobacter sp.]